jgi:RNA polymerase subunit RPABC4/transcription elongation factor Spt4
MAAQMSAPEIHKCSCNSCGEHLEYPPNFEGTTVACPHCGQGTELHQPAATQAIATNAPPPMKAGGGRGSVMPPNRGRAEPDPLAAAAPKDSQPTPTPESIEPIPAPEPDDPNACVNCGVIFDEDETVCVECGHRRPTVSNWDGTAIFRLVAGIIIACELLVLILQWTTTGKPLGLRQRTRHAVLIKVGLRKELTPAQAAASAAERTGANSAGAKLKDPDLLLKDHRLITDKNNGAQYIIGTVKNISQYRYLGVKVNFALLDAFGQVIPAAAVSDQTRSLGPGKDWAFKVLLLDPDAKTYRPLPPVEGIR